jgi:hypothetical protein
MTASLSDEDVEAGKAIVYVVNPPPGGGESNTILFAFALPEELKIYLPVVTR